VVVRKLSEELDMRGLVHQVTDPGLMARLDNERLTAYIGFDPTADSLHVGHLVQVLMLRRLKDAGHRAIALAGGATGLVGDPSGRRNERPLLSKEELEANLGAIRKQLETLLGDVLVVDNAEWLGSLGLLDFLRDVGKHFGVGEMIAKESVRSRLGKDGQGVSFTELSYMLLQAYDFLHLYDAYGCRLQLGASDQWGNITMGIELVKKLRGAKVFGLTTPLMVKPDGEKFGKSADGTVWLDSAKTSPYQLYQFLFRSEDAVVGSYLRRLTLIDLEEIEELDSATSSSPMRREAQRALARHVCRLVHGEAETRRAERAAGALYGESIVELDETTLLEVCSEAPTSVLPASLLDPPGLEVVELFARTGLVGSKARARTLVSQGGAYLNNSRVADPGAKVSRADLLVGRYLVLRRGSRDFHLIRFE
jgi:tyrosyl-tRNA synthetase